VVAEERPLNVEVGEMRTRLGRTVRVEEEQAGGEAGEAGGLGAREALGNRGERGHRRRPAEEGRLAQRGLGGVPGLRGETPVGAPRAGCREEEE
jgi:hypothetical protein